MLSWEMNTIKRFAQAKANYFGLIMLVDSKRKTISPKSLLTFAKECGASTLKRGTN